MSAFRLDNNHMASRVAATDPGVFPGGRIRFLPGGRIPIRVKPNLPRILNRKKDEGDFFLSSKLGRIRVVYRGSDPDFLDSVFA